MSNVGQNIKQAGMGLMGCGCIMILLPLFLGLLMVVVGILFS